MKTRGERMESPRLDTARGNVREGKWKEVSFLNAVLVGFSVDRFNWNSNDAQRRPSYLESPDEPTDQPIHRTIPNVTVGPLRTPPPLFACVK